MKDKTHAQLSRYGLREMSRREFFFGLGAGIGAAAFSSLLAGEAPAAVSPLAAKPPMFPAKAKACIWLTMEGGPSPYRHLRPEAEAGGAAFDAV